MKSVVAKSPIDERLENAETFFKSLPSAILKYEMKEIIVNEIWLSQRKGVNISSV